MAESAGDKTHDATPHRRKQAREEGQVAKSQDLASAVMLLVGLLALMWLGKTAVIFLLDEYEMQLGGTAWVQVDEAFVLNQWARVMFSLARALLPFFGLIMVAGILVNLLQVGLLFLPDKLAPDLERLDPLKGLQRIFSLSGLMRLLMGILKMGIIAAVAWFSVYSQRDAILAVTGLSVPKISLFLIDLILWTSIKIGTALLILAILDYAYQRWKHEQDLKMTTDELRDEMKNLQGDPQVMARRRAVQRQLVLNRLSSAVPKADVIITNPTELAVAVQYDPETMAAPIVVAKGAGILAQRIRRLALEHGIPIVEKKPLAQALYRDVDLNRPIPQQLYAAVAEVLAYVYQLKGKQLPKLPTGGTQAA